MPTVTMTIEEYEALMSLIRNGAGTNPVTNVPGPLPDSGSKPKKRKKSKYQRELGRQLKMLKAKHPRTAITRLMKRAHRATKKALK